MKKIKVRQTGYQAFDEEGDLIDYYHEDFKSLKQTLEFLESHTMGGKFTIVKVTHIRKKIKIHDIEVVPCYGGWYGGHSISDEDEKNQTKNPFCTRCGYKLKVSRPYLGNVRMSVVKPLERKQDK